MYIVRYVSGSNFVFDSLTLLGIDPIFPMSYLYPKVLDLLLL